MAARVEVNTVFFPWAVERARGDMDAFVARFPKLPGWISGAHKPTLKQLESFAAATHAPVGFFFLPEPPQEVLPLPDFRTLGGTELAAPSADLLDTIYACQQRQDWYRDFARSTGMEPLAFIGTACTQSAPTEVAKEIQRTLDFSLELRKQCSTWAEALCHLVSQCEDNGILVMISGIVGNNTHRVLDPNEFRGFCLLDSLAPVIFINGADSKSAQMFTLVHELAHLWLGESGVSNVTLSDGAKPTEGVRANEVWCNAVAAEVLVPLEALESQLPMSPSLDETVTTEAVRVSKRFATALLLSTYEGYTLFRDAARLLGIKKVSTVDEFATALGVTSQPGSTRYYRTLQ